MKNTLLTACMLLLSMSLMAVPARRMNQSIQLANGETVTVQLTGDEFGHCFVDQQGRHYRRTADGFERIPQAESRKMMRQAAAKRNAKRIQQSIGDMNFAPRGLVILANFQDLAFQAENTHAVMDSMLNGKNYQYDYAIGSVGKYFADQSNGQYKPHFDVIGPVTLPDSMAFYGRNNEDDNDSMNGEMVIHACQMADSLFNVDFSQYDNDNDGWVDFVYIIFAGYGENETANIGITETIWPASWDLPSAIYFGNTSRPAGDNSQLYVGFDGTYISSFAYSGELNFWTSYRGYRGFSQQHPKRNGIGTICHEFSHVIGLPDYYDTEYGYNYNNGNSPGDWSLMDSGSYNGDGDVPPNYSTYDRFFLGWSNPTLITDSQSIVIPQGNYDGFCITYNDQMQANDDPHAIYFLENRQLIGWDAQLPGHGLLVWGAAYDEDLWYNNAVNTIDNMPQVMCGSADSIYRYALINEQEINGDVYLTLSAPRSSTDPGEGENPEGPEEPEEPENPDTALDDMQAMKAKKYMIDGKLIIEVEQQKYNALGQKI